MLRKSKTLYDITPRVGIGTQYKPPKADTLEQQQMCLTCRLPSCKGISNPECALYCEKQKSGGKI